MHIKRHSGSVMQRTLWRWQGKQSITATLWASDYRLGTVCEFDGQPYVITHFVRIPNSREFEVWGRPVQAQLRRSSQKVMPAALPHRVGSV